MVNPAIARLNFHRQRHSLILVTDLVRTTPISIVHASHLYKGIKYSDTSRSLYLKQVSCLPSLLSSQAVANAQNTTDIHKRFAKPAATVNGQPRQVISDGVPIIIYFDFHVTLTDGGLAHLTNPNLNMSALTNHTIMGVAYNQQGCQNLQQRNASCLIAFRASPTNTSCTHRDYHQDESKYYDHFKSFENTLNPGDSSSIPETNISTIDRTSSERPYVNLDGDTTTNLITNHDAFQELPQLEDET